LECQTECDVKLSAVLNSIPGTDRSCLSTIWWKHSLWSAVFGYDDVGTEISQ